MEYVFVGLGGIFGALARYSISQWVGQKWKGDFPLATFGINVTGSFVLGLLYILFSKGGGNLEYIKNFAATGFLGAYTTYSTFSYEIIGLAKDGEKRTAAGYFAASLAVGLAAAYGGIILGEYLFSL